MTEGCGAERGASGSPAVNCARASVWVDGPATASASWGGWSSRGGSGDCGSDPMMLVLAPTSKARNFKSIEVALKKRGGKG
jgi:hypothetical protein